MRMVSKKGVVRLNQMIRDNRKLKESQAPMCAVIPMAILFMVFLVFEFGHMSLVILFMLLWMATIIDPLFKLFSKDRT